MINLSSNQLTLALSKEIKAFLGSNNFDIIPLPASASARKYFRVIPSYGSTFIATYNETVRENIAFIKYSLAFSKHNLRVPQILHVSDDNKIYFQTDLGDTTLFKYLFSSTLSFEQLRSLLISALNDLFTFQTCSNIPYEYAYPVDRFDEQSLRWDLHYFKYLFIKLVEIDFDEFALEKDFTRWVNLFLSLPDELFMYRDFQTRNILISNQKLFYIDYQGGRKGNPLYDLASLLYDAKANFSDELRIHLLDYYAKLLDKANILPYEQSMKFFPYVAITRIMQAFGTYGYRGLYQRKTHFIASIPLAAKNLALLISNTSIEQDFPELFNVFSAIIKKFSTQPATTEEKQLHIWIFSFSLQKGYPLPHPEHGGGFIFDCRSLPNPGREKAFEHLTGNDSVVIEYLNQYPEVQAFIDHSYHLICQAVDNYLERGFTFLSIGFGCTGGKHRSVFCANAIANLLRQRYGSTITLHVEHKELL